MSESRGLERILRPGAEAAYNALRVVAGLMFFFHGVQKIFGVLSPIAIPAVGTEVWFAGMLELVLGAAIAFGLMTVWAAFLASGQMAVAYFQVHWKLRFDEHFFPGVNHGELAVLYCFVFLFIACRGPGRLSVDALVRRR